MAAETRYSQTWRRLALRQCLVIVLFIAYLPAMMLLSSHFPTMSGGRFFFGWAACLLLAIGALAAVRCPRCGRFFTSGWTKLYNNPLAQKCVHCGQPSREGPMDDANSATPISD